MGYFPNGTSGTLWEEANCYKCVHYDEDIEVAGCPVWGAHLLYNYDAVGKNANEELSTVLNMLIPRDGMHNGRCAMLVERDKLDEYSKPLLSPCSCGRPVADYVRECTHIEPSLLDVDSA